MAAPETLTLRRLNRATLARQMLLERSEVGAVEAVERLGGLQAQEPRPPFIGLWSRVAGFRREDLVRAVHARELVRATLMRATLHLVSARDYAALRAALQPVMAQAVRVLGDRGEGLELEAVLPVARELVAARPRTFAALRAALSEAFPDVDDRALGYTVRTHLPLVMVPTEDRWAFPANADFALAEDWIGARLSPEPSPAELVRRHLAAFGPATAADVQAWSGLKGMKAVLEGLRGELAVFRDERGRALLDLPDAPRPDEEVPAPARFLPEFDSLLLAHADRARLVADEDRAGLVTKNLRVRATFLWDGRVAGTWTAERARDTATLRLAPFAPLPDAAGSALIQEGEALLRFLEEDATAFVVQAESPRRARGAPAR